MAYLALEPLLQHHASAAGTQAGNVFCFGLPFGNTHALEQLNEYTAVECLVQCYPVFLFNTTARVADALPQRAIVGKDEQTFAIGIQTADVIGVAVFGRQQIIYCANGALRIAAANITARLVEQHYNLLFRGSVATVHFYIIGRQYAQTGGVNCFAIHFHTPLGYQSVGSAARFITAGCQKLIQTHAALGGRRVTVLFCHVQYRCSGALAPWLSGCKKASRHCIPRGSGRKIDKSTPHAERVGVVGIRPRTWSWEDRSGSDPASTGRAPS